MTNTRILAEGIAAVALAGFDDPRTEPALRRAAADRDWQVRHAAAELIGDGSDATASGAG